jgi:hypothetical protein
MSNLPVDCKWDALAHLIPAAYPVELHHIFARQALVQFPTTQIARQFVAASAGKLRVAGHPLELELSPIPQLATAPDQPARAGQQSRVICIQVIKLRVYLGLYDIYEECSHFGTVKKIICFEKTGKFALVQMSTVAEASLVLANLSNNQRHLPAFQMRIQYSKNQDIVIKFNNSKSFDFTAPDAGAQFAQLRELSASESPFFEPEPNDAVPQIFDAWRPVHFDTTFVHTIAITSFEDAGFVDCDQFRNLLSQYGPVIKVKIANRGRKACYVSMANGFYARVAVTFLQNCRFMTLELCAYTEGSGSGDIVREYQSDEDIEVEDYSAMWFPSEFVAVKPPDVPLDDGAAGRTGNVIQFRSVDDAARFIGARNGAKIGGRVIALRFARPEDAN